MIHNLRSEIDTTQDQKELTDVEFFCDRFYAMKGAPPYPWQRNLFQQIIAGHWPEVIDMPTGSGKTALLWIWWLALAWSRGQQTNHIPLRLAWVVNRRVVVDQVSDELEELCQKWSQRTGESLPAPNVSTLRGQSADRGDWRLDPTVPSVIVGTVDMIGSRLVFRGYRSGRYWRPIEAGLLGLDTLLVNDEAHLSPAFAKLLTDIRQMRASEFPAHPMPEKPFRYVLLSATQTANKGNSLPRFEHDPEEDARESKRFQAIWMASKRLTLRDAANSFAATAEIWKLAATNPAPRTIVFLEKPEAALAFYHRLAKAAFLAELMTGTMRGYERDALVEREAFKRFQRPAPGETPVFLVATSAAEVGVNLTCERMITDLSEADHLIQRFGRLNRFGVDATGRPIQGAAFVVYVPPKKDSQPRLHATIEYLRELEGDVSPRQLWRHKPDEGARTEHPRTARLEKWRIESWAQTTYLDSQLRMPVEPWLHGQQREQPQTEVAWRADVALLLDLEIPPSRIEEILQVFPIQSNEKLQEPTGRVFEKLQKLRLEHDRILLVDRDQSVSIERISQLKEEDLAYRLVLLPEQMGWVGEHGMFEAVTREAAQLDVGRKPAVADSERLRLIYQAAKWTSVEPLPGGPPAGGSRDDIVEFARKHGFGAPLIIEDTSDGSQDLLVYLKKRTGRQKGRLVEVGLHEHEHAVAERAREMAAAAGLGEDFAGDFRRAGELHDRGKNHRIWQRAMGAKNEPAAKTVAARNLALLNGYRHEFGSLLKMDAAEEDDLVLHLVATHHAGGRPFFEPRQFDPLRRPEDCEQVAREAEQRFGRLQARFGPWRLAYLEALFKRADGLVSDEEGDGASE